MEMLKIYGEKVEKGPKGAGGGGLAGNVVAVIGSGNYVLIFFRLYSTLPQHRNWSPVPGDCPWQLRSCKVWAKSDRQHGS